MGPHGLAVMLMRPCMTANLVHRGVMLNAQKVCAHLHIGDMTLRLTHIGYNFPGIQNVRTCVNTKLHLASLPPQPLSGL